VNLERLEVFAEAYLNGFFGAIGHALSLTPTYGTDRIAEFSGESMALTATYQAVMGGAISGGGRIALLLKAEDACKITAAVAVVYLAPKPVITEADLPRLTEALEPCTRGGADYFNETYGNPVEFESIQVGRLTPEALEAFQAAGPGVVADFTFDIPNIAHGNGALLVSEILGDA
jgi:hypothetical protein